MRLVCVPIQFRTVAEALATRRIELAVTVADDLPRTIGRRPLFRGKFAILFDPRFVRLGARPTERAYLAQQHVIVSYNGDLRGTVEDNMGRERDVRCSVASFGSIGAIVDGSALVATLPGDRRAADRPAAPAPANGAAAHRSPGRRDGPHVAHRPRGRRRRPLRP